MHLRYIRQLKPDIHEPSKIQAGSLSLNLLPETFEAFGNPVEPLAAHTSPAERKSGLRYQGYEQASYHCLKHRLGYTV